jgi:glycosyltransferase involved in cell wall biosynthesis
MTEPRFLNPSAATQPDLSVILVTPDCYETIRKTVTSLRAQTVRERLELVIVCPSKDSLRLIESETDGFASICVIEFGEIRTLAVARVAGIHAASAPLVALGEDHAFPEPGWAEALIAEHRQPWAAVGPAFLNGNPGLMSWMSLVMDYGRWLEPVTGGITDDVPGHNSAWKRDLLLEYGSALERMMQAPTLMHWDMQAKGHQLYLEPAAQVRHVNITRLHSFILDHFYGAQIFAAARASDWSWLQRLLYVAATPVLTARTLGEWLSHIRRIAPAPKLLPRAWPLLLLSLAIWSAGEMIGYVLGMGKAEQRTLDYDANRGLHLSHSDRALLKAAINPIR